MARSRPVAGLAAVVACLLLVSGDEAPKVGGQSLEWDSISLTVKKKGKEDGLLHILDNIGGRARAGRITALMGPSGSGKTSLLNVLSGQTKDAKGLTLTGNFRVNGKARQPSSLEVAYVKQEDSFYSEMTVRETLTFHAKLRLGRSVAREDIEKRVDSLLDNLGLTKVADTPVGDTDKRGISGGERKRLSIACELIASPSVIFLDEPMSGLDSFQAANVMGTLKRLANMDHTVVLTIHQPSASLFSQVDDLVLLSEGRLMYAGEAGYVGRWLAECGVATDRASPPAEQALTAVSINTESPELRAQSRERLAVLERRMHEALGPRLGITEGGGNGQLEEDAAKAPAIRPRSSALTQFRLLFTRAWRQVMRAKGVILIKAVQQLSMAIVCAR